MVQPSQDTFLADGQQKVQCHGPLAKALVTTAKPVELRRGIEGNGRRAWLSSSREMHRVLPLLCYAVNMSVSL